MSLFLFITIIFVHGDKKDKTHVLPTYEVFSLELHNKYNTYICIHMKQSMHNNESIPVIITHVREQKNNEKRSFVWTR